MANDIDFRIQERIEKFGFDGKKILGIDIPVPYKPKDKFEEYGDINRLRDQQKQQNLYYTDKIIRGQELPQSYGQEEKKSIEPIMVKHSEPVVFTAQRQQTPQPVVVVQPPPPPPKKV